MEYGTGRVKHEGAVWFYPGVAPSLAGFPLYNQHTVGKVFSKAELRLVGDFSFYFICGEWNDFNIHNYASSIR
jgi:hypothetical protein